MKIFNESNCARFWAFSNKEFIAILRFLFQLPPPTTAELTKLVNKETIKTGLLGVKWKDKLNEIRSIVSEENIDEEDLLKLLRVHNVTF